MRSAKVAPVGSCVTATMVRPLSLLSRISRAHSASPWRVWCEGIQGLDPDLDIYEWFSIRVFPFEKGRLYVDGEPLGDM